ncbi:alpha-2-macroglobulin family protein [Ramlibacter sp. G-1-2-2]|uniref:Alpha-2-macroglobulin family protein n=1 Tax=Ramlibacter agri TaxID=2728837 RepID=A0A848GXA3_9BURK|nr:MG2 domain-containing protein [Ramlibacter agri]NML43225.1 alpha-2-macroglobulin family protein [Ramlibacter agri]
MNTLAIRIFALLAALVFAPAAPAQDYEAPAGAPFFLLTDSSFGSGEEARVRLEMAAGDLSALDETGGVDVALYRVADPLAFLRQQKNLHRVDLRASARPDGLGNALSFLWDGAWIKARKLWQSLFAPAARVSVTKEAPQLKTHADIRKPPPYVAQPVFQAPPGMQAAARFRYPVQAARPIAPPKGLVLQGASSQFTPPSKGNVYIPLGRQQPGLYVVEAAIGRHRATALLFVGDAVAVSKTSRDQMLVWVAQRAGGRPAAGARLMWSDLNGVLASGPTDSDGVAVFSRSVPETSYVFGADAAGGVFVSENFYYDSEIYNNKLYALTDRPLYRPGDEVNIKLYGREFTGARASRAMAAGPIALTVLDAQGTPVFTDKVAYDPAAGGETRFRLPAEAPAGGYEIRMTRGDDEYGAAFRVAQYVKPHFEILVEPGKPAFKTGEEITGRIRLAYPDGKPVANAVLSLSARAQMLTMVEGDLVYGGAFPLQIGNNQDLSTDSKGYASFKLPAAKEPSRLVLSVLATDGAAQRVRATQQLLIERSASAYMLRPQKQFAAAREAVQWRFALADGAPAGAAPAQWVAVHQESQTSTRGNVAGGDGFALQLERPGSYMVQLRDAQDRLLGAAPFYVAGGELKPPQGAVEIVLDKPRYRPGETARALITFPDAVDDALLTLERDRVESWGRLAGPGKVAALRRLNDRQWEAVLQVSAEFAPNITFSVAYVRGREFGFQNAGILVEQPALQVVLKTDKPSYAPGETATVDIETQADGVATPASLALGVVDEMVYVLQPELAPGIVDFFYHPRRNNVRTHSSLAFISYDEAAAPAGQEVPRSRGTQERGIKLLERPRRDERDTAFWSARVTTDAQGHARISFTVPDALTRWRVTARGVGLGRAEGLVGEKRAWFQSDKEVYAKWTSPDWARAGDRPVASLAVFNQGTAARDVQVALEGAGAAQSRTLSLAPGANFVAFELPPSAQDANLTLQVRQGGRVLDQLQTRWQTLPAEWADVRESLVTVAAGQDHADLKLPADASAVRIRALAAGAADWNRVADALLDYPYGCLEQTASRMLPLALGLRALPGADDPNSPLRQRLYASRLRLASMAGPDAVFGWWGDATRQSAFFSAYAYYADFLATQTLGMQLPAAHWQRLVEIYGKGQENETPVQRALALWMMREMGLPTATYARGLADVLAAMPLHPAAPAPGGSWVFGEEAPQQAVALVLVRQLFAADNIAWPAALEQPLEQARRALADAPQLFAQALAATTGAGRPEGIQKALQEAAESDTTFERAISLAWLAKASGLKAGAAAPVLAPGAGWQSLKTATGAAQWAWTAPGAAAQSLALGRPAAEAFTLSVRYESHARGRETLPVRIERKLFRLERKDKLFKAVPIERGEALSTSALYLDQVTVSAGRPLRQGLLEVALPPGAFMEPSTWGVEVGDTDKHAPLERAAGEATRQGYTVPFDALDGTRTVRHLVRFGQKGRFTLPAARLWRMYQPEAKAYEAGADGAAWTVQ